MTKGPPDKAHTPAPGDETHASAPVLLNWWQTNSAFLASACFHALLLLVLALLILPRAPRDQVALEFSLTADAENEEPFSHAPLQMLASSLPERTLEDAFVEPDQVFPEETPLTLDLAPTDDFLFPDMLPDFTTDLGGGAQTVSGEMGSGAAAYGDIQDRVARAGGRTGMVQISLAWNNFNDIDLHVMCPSGERIWFGEMNSSCGGELDVDMNAGGPDSETPVENIVWAKEKAPSGHYQVIIHHYANHGAEDPTYFQVSVKVGQDIRLLEGQLTYGEDELILYQFDVISSGDTATLDEPVEFPL